MYICSSERRSQQPKPQVCEGEKVSEAFHTLHACVQVVHVLQFCPSKYGKAFPDLESHILLILGTDPARVLLGTYDSSDVRGRQFLHPLWQHPEGLHTVISVVLVRLPGSSIIQGLVQHHYCGPPVLKGYLDVIC